MDKIINIRDEKYQRINSGGVDVLIPVEQVGKFLGKETHYKRLQELANHVKRFAIENNAVINDLSYDYEEHNSVWELAYILEQLYKLGVK